MANFLRVIPGGLYNTKVYRGHVSGSVQRIVVARSANEAYALMLDSLAYKNYDFKEVYTDLEEDENIINMFSHSPVGVYKLSS